MGKFRTIDSFFKKNEDSNSENSTLLGSNVEASTSNERPSKSSIENFTTDSILDDFRSLKERRL